MDVITNSNTSSYAGIDIVKFVMAIFVVMIHTLQVNNVYFHMVLELAVPFFFTASGFFLQAKLGVTDEKLQIIKRWTLRLLKLYLLWTLVYLPFTLLKFIRDGQSITSCAFDFVRQVFFIGGGYYSYHLWYLLASVTAGVILWLFEKIKIMYYWLFAFSLLMYVLGLIIDEIHPDLYYKVFGTTRNGLFVGLFMIAIGMGIKMLEPVIGRNQNNSLISAILLVVISILVSPFQCAFIGAGCVFILVLCVHNKRLYHLDKYAVFFRAASTQIYLIHMAFVGVISLFSIVNDVIILFLIAFVLSFVYSCVHWKLSRTL